MGWKSLEKIEANRQARIENNRNIAFKQINKRLNLSMRVRRIGAALTVGFGALIAAHSSFNYDERAYDLSGPVDRNIPIALDAAVVTTLVAGSAIERVRAIKKCDEIVVEFEAHNKIPKDRIKEGSRALRDPVRLRDPDVSGINFTQYTLGTIGGAIATAGIYESNHPNIFNTPNLDGTPTILAGSAIIGIAGLAAYGDKVTIDNLKDHYKRELDIGI